MVLVPRTSASAQNRFLYHNGKIQKIPSTLFSAMKAMYKLPIFEGVLSDLVNEWRVPRSKSLAYFHGDESVHDFFSRRLGPRIADTFVSAIIHGIYAGDSRHLSVKALMPSLVELEQTHGGILRSFLPRLLNGQYRAPQSTVMPTDQAKMADVESRLNPALVKQLPSTSIYSFPQGLGEIVQALENELIATSNVEIWKDSACEHIAAEYPFRLTLRHMKEPLYADRIIAGVPSHHLARLLPDLPHLAHNPAAHLAVVDVVLARHDRAASYELPVHGFGYLVPRSAKPNPHDILGVIFDSDAMPNQLEILRSETCSPSSQPFTKLTVMMGGPYWRERASLPSEEEAEERALRALHTQLGIPLTVLSRQVRHVRSRVLTDTIPQYLVGHPQRMQELHTIISTQAPWQHRLSLLGYSYGGVGVNDCIATAMDTCEAISDYELGLDAQPYQRDMTGLKEAARCA